METISIGVYDYDREDPGHHPHLTGIRVSMADMPQWLDDYDGVCSDRLRLIYGAAVRSYDVLPAGDSSGYMLGMWLDDQATTLGTDVGIAVYCGSDGHVLDAYCAYTGSSGCTTVSRLATGSVRSVLGAYLARFGHDPERIGAETPEEPWIDDSWCDADTTPRCGGSMDISYETCGGCYWTDSDGGCYYQKEERDD